MTATKDEQYRAGFEAWAKTQWFGHGTQSLSPFSGEYTDDETNAAWLAYVQAMREASTEPSAEPWAYALMREGKVEGVERTKRMADCWVKAEIVPLYPARGAQKDEAKDAARYRWLREPTNTEGPSMVTVYGEDALDRKIDAAIAAHTKAQEKA